ncbi:zinc-dependent alcohol dehydrogenase family protein [Aestuariivirga litoralis]|uniref:zinc-dependent alcohol dehydrogenase family protein n=1 Tax=Aestuariivirga litoralis TaxID=2650924 RepID=UPI0018C4FC1A|nr:zinc-dependent alcohol dehydrogenase family protein [Aestuariivirga litoralis]MBG1232484.1 zinc-dependent alcohol dehydrogenase family protein [Aestuariivirga litoralis]
MRAVYYEKFEQPPVISTVKDPRPAAGGLVVKVEATGLCRSDFHGWMGHDSDIHLPHVPGHELAGTVVALGKDIRNFKIGDRVTVPFVSGCGHCAECHSGNQQVCESQFQPGFTAWGSFADYVALDYADANVVRLPDAMDYETAAALGCRFATSFRAVVDQAKLKGGEFIAVHGCGGVGLSAVMIGAAVGGIVIAVDVDDEKLALARALGASFTINGKSGDVVGAIREFTKGGAQVSLDALGHKVTSYNSISCLRRRGRHVQVGLMNDGPEPTVPMSRIIAHELEIYGSHGMQAHRYPAMLAMIEAGKFKPQSMITKRIGLDEAPAALMAMSGFAGSGITMIRM